VAVVAASAAAAGAAQQQMLLSLVGLVGFHELCTQDQQQQHSNSNTVDEDTPPSSAWLLLVLCAPCLPYPSLGYDDLYAALPYGIPMLTSFPLLLDGMQG
jgi:hypothetical protein